MQRSKKEQISCRVRAKRRENKQCHGKHISFKNRLQAHIFIFVGDIMRSALPLR